MFSLDELNELRLAIVNRVSILLDRIQEAADDMRSPFEEEINLLRRYDKKLEALKIELMNK